MFQRMAKAAKCMTKRKRSANYSELFKIFPSIAGIC